MKRTHSPASKTTAGPLTATEMWELGQAIIGNVDRKISGRLDLAWGAGKWHDNDDRRGLVIPSKGGKLLVGNHELPKTAVEVTAAPGTGKNQLFTLYHRKGTTDREIWGVRFAATAPVRWKVQKPIRLRGFGARAAVWTPGLAYAQLDWDYRTTARGAVLETRSELTAKAPLGWALGFDADARPVCMLFACPDATLLSRIDGQVLATPPADELAALRAQPHRLALTETELRVLATAIAKSGTKQARRPDHKWKGIDVSAEVWLGFAGREVARVPSVKGELCLGNLRDPKRAIRVQLGGADNLSLALRLDKGLGQPRKPMLHGVTLSSETPVRWRLEGTFARGRAWWLSGRTDAAVGVWSSGLERTAPERFDNATSPDLAPGVHAWLVDAASSRLGWYVGYDADDRPAVLLVGDPRVEVSFERAAVPLAYTKEHAKAAAGAVVAARREGARVARADKKREAEEDAAADAPAPPATAAELLAIGAAIAAGPRKRRKITERFSLSWQDRAIPTVDGELYVGDPDGASFPLAAGEGAKATFTFFDTEGADDRAVIGLRLGDGPAVQWKVGMGLGVDSGRYGVWSPGYPTDDASFGLKTSGGRAGMILPTLDGDCCFPSMLGLDANQRPVAFLFGEAVDPAVFKAARRPLA